MEDDATNGKTESERKHANEEMTKLKAALERLSGDEQDAVTRKMQAEDELRLEQSKLTQLQDALDRIDKDLERASAASASVLQ